MSYTTLEVSLCKWSVNSYSDVEQSLQLAGGRAGLGRADTAGFALATMFAHRRSLVATTGCASHQNEPTVPGFMGW